MNAAMTLPVQEPIPTRYSLLSRLRSWDDQESWKDFFDTYWRLIYAVALRSGLAADEAEDVVQETIICVARDIHKFKRDRSLGTFKGWLRNITRWRIADRLKKRLKATPEEVDLTQLADATGDSETVWETEWQSNLLGAALERVKRRVKEEHYQIFDLYVLRGWPVSKVTQTLGVNIGQVYLAKHRVSALLKKEVRALENRWD